MKYYSGTNYWLMLYNVMNRKNNPKPKNVMLCKSSQKRKSHILWFHLHEKSRKGKWDTEKDTASPLSYFCPKCKIWTWPWGDSWQNQTEEHSYKLVCVLKKKNAKAMKDKGQNTIPDRRLKKCKNAMHCMTFK